MADIVRGAKYYLEFHKGQFQDLCYSILSYALCFTFLRTLILQIMQKTTPQCGGKSAKFAVNNLEKSSTIPFEWLNNNYMKVNTGKSHLLLSGNSRATAMIENSYAESEDEQVLLG